jgi:hypothetical protein
MRERSRGFGSHGKIVRYEMYSASWHGFLDMKEQRGGENKMKDRRQKLVTKERAKRQRRNSINE